MQSRIGKNGGRVSKNSDTKRWLMSALAAEREVDALLLEMERVHALRTRITAVWRETTSGGGGSTDSRAEATVRLIELEEQLEDRIALYRGRRAEVDQVICQVESARQRELLRLRYLCDMSFKTMADHLGHDLRSVFRLHGRALESVRRILIREENKRKTGG